MLNDHWKAHPMSQFPHPLLLIQTKQTPLLTPSNSLTHNPFQHGIFFRQSLPLQTCLSYPSIDKLIGFKLVGFYCRQMGFTTRNGLGQFGLGSASIGGFAIVHVMFAGSGSTVFEGACGGFEWGWFAMGDAFGERLFGFGAWFGHFWLIGWLLAGTQIQVRDRSIFNLWEADKRCDLLSCKPSAL